MALLLNDLNGLCGSGTVASPDKRTQLINRNEPITI
jgi:hypothetical protein